MLKGKTSFKYSLRRFLCVIFLMLIFTSGMGSYFIIKYTAEITGRYQSATMPVLSISGIKTNIWQVYTLTLQMGIDRNPDALNACYKKILAIRDENELLLQAYKKNTESDPEALRLYQEFEQWFDNYKTARDNSLLLALEPAESTIREIKIFNREQLQPAFDKVSRALDALNAHTLANVVRENDEYQKHSRTALGIIGLGLVFSIILLGTWGILWGDHTLHVVTQATDFAIAAVEGSLSHRMDKTVLERGDEFGIMARALSVMQESLSSMIAQMRDNAASLTAANEAAQAASASKSSFLSRMSHEIRTPLNAIIGMTYVARKARTPAVLNDSLNKIVTASTHLLGIINDILDMSKIEAGKLVLEEEEFGLEQLLIDVCAVSSAKTDEKTQDLSVTIAPDVPHRFRGDPLRLSQVLTNLLSNASKFTPPKGKIRVSVSCLEKNPLASRVRFIVEDTGIGMTEEQLKHLFMPFEQADGSTARLFGGTGLGLTICDSISKMMDGYIQVESEFGKGSRFILTVKLFNVQKEAPRQLDPSVDAQRIRVLLVGESQDDQALFLNILRELQISVAVAQNKEAALELLENHANHDPFNILFLDWDSAHSDARADFVRAVKTRFGDQIAVVMVSAAKLHEIEEKAAEVGVSRFLAKPVFPSSVVNLVNEIVRVPQEREVTAPEGTESADFSGKHILLAEDVDINREIVFAYLEHTGVTIDVAENGVEAIEKYLLAEGGYDLVLMDIHMPVMDGYVASKRIREEEKERGWPATPIIAMTANAFKEDMERCFEAGMDGHLAKPMDAAIAEATLRQHLEREKVCACPAS